nr:unnamed protein product [Callosobruchus chinensis]
MQSRQGQFDSSVTRP